MKKILFIAILFTSSIQISIAHNNIAISLSKAKEIALENSYQKKQTQLDIDVARKKVWEAISAGLPQVSANAGYTKNLNIPVSMLPAEIFGGKKGVYTPVKFGQKYSGNWGVAVSQKIFDGSYIIGTLAAKVFVDIAKNKNIKTEISIKESINTTYYTILLIKEQEKIIIENISIIQKTLKETQALYNNGFKEKIAVDQLKLMLKRSENKLSDTKRQLSNTKLLMNFIMGKDINSQIVLSDKLSDLVNPIIIENKIDINLNTDSHIDIVSMNTQVLAQKLRIKNEYAKFLPKIDVFYNFGKNTAYNSANILKDDAPWFKSSMIGIKASMQLFTGFRRIASLQRENINYNKLQIQNTMLKESLSMEIQKSDAELKNAKENYLNNVEALGISKKIYNQTRIKFKEGISTSSELSQIEQQYLQSNSTFINSTLRLLNAKTSLDKAQGKL